jgi:Protein of unknown function (DUF1302)
MLSQHHQPLLWRIPVNETLRAPASIILGLGASLLTANASAVQFDLGPLEGNFSSNFSVGASWRTQDPSNRVVSPGNTNGEGRASSGTADDGNLNYDEGDMYSFLFKGVHDLRLEGDNYGVFTRFKYWYDYALDNDNVAHGHAANGYASDEELNTSDFESLAQESGFEFLDYYVYADFEAGDMPIDLRAGNMVLSWGESTFIQNGVNVINPFDATALRRPGSEIKEALLPVGMVYANIGLTHDLSIEMFYQYEWQRTILDECGTYWSSADPYGGGCNYLTATASRSDLEQTLTDYIVERQPDEEASDSGQWGIAARYFVESLNASEFGFYYVNVHSRTPIFSGVNPTENFGQPFLFGSDPAFFFEFPEDIDLYGLTFATNVYDWAWSGELSYRDNFPLQISTTDILHAVAVGDWAEWSPMLERSQDLGPGAALHGYDEVSYIQLQSTFIRFFEQVLGASRLSFAAEVGATWLDDMEDGINYGRSPAYGTNIEPFDSEIFGVPVTCNSHPALEPTIVPNANAGYCEDNGFITDFSWGYRVRAGLEYSDVFAGVNLTPNMAWSHDVKGTSPPPNFVDNRMALSVGVKASYLNIYQADLSYTSFFGADYNEQEDRDFISLSFSAAF